MTEHVQRVVGDGAHGRHAARHRHTGPAAYALGAALEHAAARVRPRADGVWQFRLPGTQRIATAELSARWLSIGLALRASRKPCDGSVVDAALRRNARAPGLARLVDGAARREVVVDLPVDVLPWDSESELDGVVSLALSHLASAASTRGIARSAAPAETPGRDALEGAFDTAGWPAQPGPEETLEVPLDVPGRYVPGSVVAAHGVISVRAPLRVDATAPPTVCRDAVRVLVWRVASRSRMIRPLRSRAGLALEASLPGTLTDAPAAAHLCASLSSALRQLTDETHALCRDEDLARLYLSVTGFLETA